MLEKLSVTDIMKILKMKKKEKKLITVKRAKIQENQKPVQELINYYEDIEKQKNYPEYIIEPPVEFRDKPIPAPRKKKEKPIAAPRTVFQLMDKASKGYSRSYNIGVIDEKDALVQLQNARLAIITSKKFYKK